MEQSKIPLENTVGIETPEGGIIFQSGVIVRKVYKILLASSEDGIIPIQVIFDPISGKILKETLPPALRKEYEDKNLII